MAFATTRLVRSLLGMALVGSAVAAPLATADDSTAGRCTSVGSSDWPLPNHDLSGTRTQPQTTIGVDNANQLQPLWSINLTSALGEVSPSIGYSTPVVVGGCVFVTLNSGEVAALDIKTGRVLWDPRVFPGITGNLGQAIGGSLTVVDGVVYVLGNVETDNAHGGPMAAALDASTGAILWRTDTPLNDFSQTDGYGEGPLRDVCPLESDLPGACAQLPYMGPDNHAFTNASPVVWRHYLLAGWSVPEEADARGGYSILDTTDGAVLATHYLIPDSEYAAGYRGSGIWATAVVDSRGYAYVGTSDPSTPAAGHPTAQESRYADAIVKIDLKPGRQFGQVVGVSKGTSETDNTSLDNQPACQQLGDRRDLRVNGLGYAPFDGNVACAQADYDFGASPNLFTLPNGRQVVGELQKSGVYHAAYTDTMTTAFDTTVSGPDWPGGTTAYDPATGTILGTTQTHDFAIDAAAAAVGAAHPVRYFTPDPDVLVRFQATTVANGVTYVADNHQTWSAYDEGTGRLLHRAVPDVDYLTQHPDAARAGYRPFIDYGSYGITVAEDTVLVPAQIADSEGFATQLLVAYRILGDS